MLYKNKKGQIGKLVLLFVGVIFFFSVYPFWQSSFDVAASVHTGFLQSVIEFIPFLVLLLVFAKVIGLGGDSTP